MTIRTVCRRPAWRASSMAMTGPCPPWKRRERAPLCVYPVCTDMPRSLLAGLGARDSRRALASMVAISSDEVHRHLCAQLHAVADLPKIIALPSDRPEVGHKNS
jgi:hypothetical protein